MSHAMGSGAPTSLRMTMAAARAAQRASEWQYGDPHYKPAWSEGNMHKITMEKARPHEMIPEPLAPVPTLAELSYKPESKVRCFHPALQKQVVNAHLEKPQGSRSTMLSHEESNSSFVSRRSAASRTSGRRGSQEGGSTRRSQAGVDDAASVAKGGTLALAGDKHAASLRKKELMELRRKEENEKRLAALHDQVRKNQAAKDEAFTSMYQNLKEEKATFVKDLCHYLDNKERAAEQKRKALHTEWTECVFNKIQDQLLDRVDTMEAEEISARRRQLFQNYIDASARKGGGLFLDIVIENEYDPFTWKKDTLKYRAKPAVVSNGPGFTDRFGNPVHDPVKRDLEKLKSEAEAARNVGGGPDFGDLIDGKLGRDTLSHEHWSKMEATPFFDRAAKVLDAVAAGKAPPVRKGQTTTIEVDDYRYPSGPNVVTKELHGLYGRGKRTFKDWQPGQTVHKGTTGGGGGGGGGQAQAQAQAQAQPEAQAE